MKWNNKGHQFDTWGKQFRKRNKIYIYGAAEAGEKFVRQLEALHFEEYIDGFIDKDVEKQKNGFLGKPVYSPDILFEQHEEDHIIVPTFKEEKNANRVIDRLLRAGYVENWDWFRTDKFIIDLFDNFLPLYALYANNKFIMTSMCVVPSTRCNLNCRDCLNFTPHLPSFEDQSFDNLCKDVNLLFKWVDYTYRFQISGGEPLLYCNMLELITYIGEKFRHKIEIFETIFNGTIIPSDDMCEAMSKYRVTVYLDNYVHAIPSEMNRREAIIEKLEKYKITWIDNTVDEWFDLGISDTDNSHLDEQSMILYYDSCNNPWHCYENGKIYACNFARFAMKANLNKDSENDYFDLSKVNESNKTELMEFILNYNTKGYVDFCKKCSGWCSINKRSVPVAVQAERKKSE